MVSIDRRILVGQVSLAPWFKSIVHKPVQRVAKVVYNFRVLASVLYSICNKIDPLLQPLPTFVGQRKPQDDKGVEALVINDGNAGRGTNETVRRVFHVFWDLLFTSKEERDMSEIEAAVNEDIQIELLSEQRDIFGPIDNVQRFLVTANELTWLQLEKSEWIRDLAITLDSWLSSVVQAVVERKTQRSHQTDAS